MIDFGFNSDEKVVVAVSGGVDSVCLLDLVVKHSGLPLEQIVVAHLDHGLRDDSADDLEFVRALAQCYGVFFVGERIEVSDDEGNLEARARKIRYDFLESVREEVEADWILTAHHKDDQAETVLMNLLKGTFVRGLGGMREKDEDRKLFRPLLDWSKQEFLDYAGLNNLGYRDDSTNFDQKFDRNYLRLSAIPFLEERFNGFADRLASNSDYFKELDTYLETKALEWINTYTKSEIGGVTFNLSQFFVQPSFLRFLILSKLLQADLSQADFEEINKVVCEGQAGSQREVGDFNIYVSSDKVLISDLDLDEIAGLVFKKYIADLDQRKANGLNVKTYEDGDRYLFGKSKSPKKLKEYFVKNKVPWYYRRGLPLIVDSKGLVRAVLPYKNLS